MANRPMAQEPLRARHCTDLARHLSVMDQRELIATGAWDPKKQSVADVLSTALKDETCTSYAVVNPRSGCVYAVGGYDTSGTCWFLTSRIVSYEFDAKERALFRSILHHNLIETLKIHPVLHNVVMSKNVRHVKLIESMGARMGEEGHANGEQFQHFEFHREDFPQFQQEV